MNLVSEVEQTLADLRWFRLYGKVVKVVGMTIESIGPRSKLGDICSVESQSRSHCLAEVVGFREERVVLMPLGDLGEVEQGAKVLSLQQRLSVNCSTALLGRVLDGLGRPLDDKGPIAKAEQRMIEGPPLHPLNRSRITEVVQTGVRALDGLLTVGRGQRMGIFAGSGVGKSTLLGMIAKNTSADVNVIALIGERGREVREFIEGELGPEGMERSVVVVSTSNEPALIRLKAAFVATAVAEYFRDKGLSVNLMMDSVTRFAMAQREVGLAVGEPPTSRGYTPSVFALLPKLLERAGAGQAGSITAFYTVLVDGDDLNDPISDAVRGILDGHVVLSRKLANSGRFPAVDILASISRLFNSLADPLHQQANRQVRDWLQRYTDVEDLIRIGAYQPGAEPETDVAVDKFPLLREFLEQRADEPASLAQSILQLQELAEVRA
ncbi:FliI/YscN family ATPase [Alicyclobacillus sp. SO9]|uniref:FliI/YscN family ATPase n=1 Tax=Alicyclobacillus sp. SO9 TaxID=2665646 RepID=UPI0018E7A921|nr:FliI/YscN family ATPase [Alicyclobacillus sp. SO9]QQE80805.1 FliI/YscN family ATPase [Alicyclobacillus sp. SO9]